MKYTKDKDYRKKKIENIQDESQFKAKEMKLCYTDDKK